MLTARALRTVGNVVLEFPEVSVRHGTDTVALRRWLRGYNAAQANEAAMLRVWLDAALQTPAFRAESAPLHDWGRRRVSRYLGPRGFGDVDMEAVVMVALLGVFGAGDSGRPPKSTPPPTSSNADSWAADVGLERS